MYKDDLGPVVNFKDNITTEAYEHLCNRQSQVLTFLDVLVKLLVGHQIEPDEVGTLLYFLQSSLLSTRLSDRIDDE